MDVKSTFWRAVATAAVWLMMVGALALTGLFLAPEIGDDSLAVVIVLMITTIVTNGFIWDWGRGQGTSRRERKQLEAEVYERAATSLQKRKRDEVGTRLSDLSDDQLLDLRERLQSGDVDDEELAYLLKS